MEYTKYLRAFREIRPTCWEQWQTFWKVYRLHERIDNLQGLIEWASRKRLKQRHYYQFLLSETQVQLTNECLRYRKLSRRTYRWYRITSFLFPARRYHPKGSAHIYRRSYAYEKPKNPALSKLVKSRKQS